MSSNFQRHFRKFHSKQTTGHPSYVFDEKGNKYKIISITSAPSTNNVLNVKLERNPEPGNKNPAYIHPRSKEVPKGTKNKRLKGWSFSGIDKKKVQAIIDKDKKKIKK